MKLTKALCLVAATAALALAPINTSTGQTNTVLAIQKSTGHCTHTRSGWFKCPDGGSYYDESYDTHSSWLIWLYGAFYSAWEIITSWFK
ncbi:hypothetical protein KVF94_00835 [Streptococcus equi subsp. zooepidemicus]|uniref:hypothetical protein n=1 Tax=Streptococcus equi TaxID=1336 RepID=UPI001E540E01|nr:hypothetical protein [Streptococcus equi]MCD3400311.1 hypothetical protein [Streptococcus equi subsp. zooepidemicus]